MNNSRDVKEGMIRLLITGTRVWLIAATMVVTLSMITFAQTTKPIIESTPTATNKVVTSDSLKLDKKSTDHDTSVQTDSPAGTTISAAVKVEIQHHVNELRREQLDEHEKYIDYWLSAVAIVLAFFGIVVVVAGYIGFRRFREIETEAKGYVEEIKKHRDEADKIRQDMTAQTVVDDPEKAKQVVANVGENPTASPIDRTVARALSLQQQGKKNEAIEKWRAVAHVSEEGDNDQAARAWFSVGYLFGKENPEDCLLANNEAIRLKPDYANAYNNRGVANFELDRYEEAISDYDEAIRLKPDFVEAYINRGAAKTDWERYDEAIADYDEAIRLKPDHDVAYYNRGVLKGKLDRHEEAFADFDEAIRRKSDFAEAYYNRGFANAELRQHEDAISDYDEAIRRKSDFAEAYKDRGNAKVALGQRTDAIADYDEAIRLNPDYAEAYYNRGLAKGALGLIDEARQDFENARDLAREAGNDSLADDVEQRLRDLGQ